MFFGELLRAPVFPLSLSLLVSPIPPLDRMSPLETANREPIATNETTFFVRLSGNVLQRFRRQRSIARERRSEFYLGLLSLL